MKFKINQIVRHVKNGCNYKIVGTPDKYLITTGEPAYAYTRGEDADIYVRKQSEMEDGRFIAITS